jgi:hypothetical protein
MSITFEVARVDVCLWIVELAGQSEQDPTDQVFARLVVWKAQPKN